MAENALCCEGLQTGGSKSSSAKKGASVSTHTSPALKSREQTCAMKEDSSGPSDVVLDGSYNLRVFCHILVIASRTDFYRA